MKFVFDVAAFKTLLKFWSNSLQDNIPDSQKTVIILIEYY